MVKVRIEYKRKRDTVIWLCNKRWLDSVANLDEAGMLKGASAVYAWHQARPEDEGEMMFLYWSQSRDCWI